MIHDRHHCVRRHLAPLSSMAMAVAAISFALPSGAQPSEEDELALAYGDKSFVSIATGSKLPVGRAPAVATVVTAEEIAAIGATDLDDVLETVPGLHVARQPLVYAPTYVIRGINLGYNPQVLMLVNGVPLTTVFTGNRGSGWAGLPVHNIERIEVIRGPGSALYGADAFAGVINIITKKAGDVAGSQVGLRGGSYDSKDLWVQHGGKWGAVDVAAYLRAGHTDGARNTINADAQTGWDGVFHTQASHAPGPINNERDFLDGSLDLSLDKWRLRAGYKERRKAGSGSGVASALDPTGTNLSQTISSDLNYDDDTIAPDWALSLQGSWLRYKENSYLVLYPPGAFGGAFSGGVIGAPDKWERHQRFNGSGIYTGWQHHRLRLGLGVQNEEVFRIRERKNYSFGPAGLAPIGTGSAADVTDVSDTSPFLRPHDRVNRNLYVQDEWNLASDWTLTSGLRHDRYSDFGHTTNPRLALVWEAAYNVSAKLLYASAFRAPSMSELYAINNPVVTGNPKLKPEHIRTSEAAVSWQTMPGLQLNMNVFRYAATDIIKLVQGVYQNAGEQTGKGMELEAVWDANKALRLSGNYSYQYSIDHATGHDAGNSPHSHVYLRADWQWAPRWSLHSQLNWVGERPRVTGDSRPSLAGYRTVDLTLRTRSPSSAWEWVASVRNLLNADAREPSPYDRSPAQPFVSLPSDFPLPGRTLYLQGTYRF